MLEKVRTRSFHLMIAHILVIGCNALAYFLLAAILDPEIFGALFFFIAIINFILAFSVMGFQHVLMHQVPRLSEKNKNKELSTLVHDTWSVCMTTSVIISALFCLWHFFIKPIPMPGADGAALLIMIIAPIWTFLRTAPVFILSRGGVFSGILPDQGMHFLGLMLMPALVYLSIGALDDIPFLLAGQIIAGIAGATVTYYYVKHYFKELGNYQFRFWKPLKEWKKLNLPFFAFSLSQQAVQRLDLVIVGFLLGGTQVAIYALAVKIAQLLYLPAMASRAALAPRFSLLFEREEYKSINSLLLWSTLALALISLTLGVSLYFITPFALTFLDNIYLKDSLKILLVLIAAEFVISTFTPIKLRFLMGYDQQKLSLIFFTGLLANAALNIYYIPINGIEAAAYIRFGVMLVIHLAITAGLVKKETKTIVT